MWKQIVKISFLFLLLGLVIYAKAQNCDKKIYINFRGQIDRDNFYSDLYLKGVKVEIISMGDSDDKDNRDEIVLSESISKDSGYYNISLCTDTVNFFIIRFSRKDYISKYCVIDLRTLILSNSSNEEFNMEISTTMFNKKTLNNQKLINLSEKIPAAVATYDVKSDNILFDRKMIEVFKSVRRFFESYTIFSVQKDSVELANHQKSMELSRMKEEQLKDKNQKLLFGFIGATIFVILVFVVVFYLRTRKSRNILSQSNKIIENKNFLLEEKQKEITDSINYAKRIQSTLLENVKELEGFKHEYFILFMPKDIVSGDFYWMKRLGNNFFVSVCDSTGHGVPGAFMSLLNSSMMNEAVVTKNISDPGNIFDSTRSGLMATLSHENSKDGMDAILMNFSDNTIKYAAANNKPVLVRKGELTELKCDKMPVGYSENSSPFQTLDIEAQSGDMIYLYTDGFADQFGGSKGKKFKYANLNKLLVSISEKQLSEQKQVLQNALREWMGDLEQVDDICIVGIRIS